MFGSPRHCAGCECAIPQASFHTLPKEIRDVENRRQQERAKPRHTNISREALTLSMSLFRKRTVSKTEQAATASGMTLKDALQQRKHRVIDGGLRTEQTTTLLNNDLLVEAEWLRGNFRGSRLCGALCRPSL